MKTTCSGGILMDSTSHFLVNLLVILVGLLFLQFRISHLQPEQTQTKIIMFFCLTFTISFCMLFPFKSSGGIVFDMRLVPFVLGCLYAGRLTRIWMVILIIGLRLSQGFEHSWLAIMNIILFYIMIMLCRERYLQLSKLWKNVMTTSLMILMSLWTLVGVKIFFHLPVTLPISFSYIGIQTGGMLIVGYMVESIREQQMVFRRLIRMEKMEVASHLAASISHEIRNPLTSTRGFLQLLSESQEIPDPIKEYITIATSELDHAEEIIRDYLTFAKPAPENFEPLMVQTQIEKALRIIDPLAKMNHVEIVSNLCSCSIKGNPGMFQQVLINIIKNGIEAMQSGGTLTIRCHKDKSHAGITISDEGVGMTAQQKSRLGEPYFTTKGSKGTGLGMMVVFRIVESMNGKIQIDSKQGMGTSITLQFPLS
jgi:two-component system sporulation sensor kinase B